MELGPRIRPANCRGLHNRWPRCSAPPVDNRCVAPSFSTPEVGVELLWWVGKGAVLWWVQYHYRPGTITSWIADLLERHAIRRRSEFALPPTPVSTSPASVPEYSIACKWVDASCPPSVLGYENISFCHIATFIKPMKFLSHHSRHGQRGLPCTQIERPSGCIWTAAST